MWGPLAQFQDTVDAEAAKNKELYQTLCYAFLVMDGILLCLILFLRHRIKIAIGIIREASKSIKAMPLIMVFPLVPCFWCIVLVAYFLTAGMYIASMGSVVSHNPLGHGGAGAASAFDTDAIISAAEAVSEQARNNTLQFVPSPLIPKYLAYHVFGLLWTNQLIAAIVVCTIAGAVSKYYWSTAEDKEFGRVTSFQVRTAFRRTLSNGSRTALERLSNGSRTDLERLSNGALPALERLSSFQVLTAFRRTLRFHVGSLAFGSFLIAVVQFLRLVLEYVDQKTKELQERNRWAGVRRGAGRGVGRGEAALRRALSHDRKPHNHATQPHTANASHGHS
jgi:choline transporter-like protein 2/4/5